MSKYKLELGDVFKHPDGSVYLVVNRKGELRDVKMYDPNAKAGTLNAYLNQLGFYDPKTFTYVGSLAELGRRISNEF